VNGVAVSFHPAGHILGSAQIRVEHRGEVWVISGDYKTEPDPTCATFEPVRCHTFVTECTFGLPVYRWAPSATIRDEMHGWLRANRDAGNASFWFGYARG
jgi:putative mRNA 3-end processing factor